MKHLAVKHFIAAVTAAASLGLSAGTAGARLTVELEPGEGWWGGSTVFGCFEPFGLNATNHFFDIRRHCCGNQASPLLLSTHGRYVWCDKGFSSTLKDGRFELVSTNGVPFVTGRAGTTLREAFRHASKNFFPPAGKTPDLMFVSAPQWNTWIELGLRQNQKQILEYAHAIVDNGFPAGVIMLDDTWQRDYGNWEFDGAAFPDPKGMMDELHALGFKVILWVVPFVSADSPAYRELLAIDGGAPLLRKANRRAPASIVWWNGQSAVLDMTNPKAQKWFREKLDRLQREYGADGFKFDGGDIGYYDLADQGYAEDPAIKQGVLEENTEAWARFGLDYPFNEYRACWKMGGQPLVQRLCDKSPEWSDLRRLIPDMIGAGLLGYQFVCPDMIGGGMLDNFWGGKFDKEEFIRSAQVHALAPMMQFSAAPWRMLGAEDLAIIRDAVATRQRYAPRYVELAKECAVSGEPMLRSMDYQFPGCGYEKVTDQFVIGDFLIVAPQLYAGAASREVLLPEGEWRGDDGVVVKGPAKVTVATPLSRLPYFEAVR